MDYPGLEKVVEALLSQGREIEAVKWVRRATGRGLSASKDYVDRLERAGDFPPSSRGPVDYEAFSDAQLLAALEYGGEALHPDLIRACLARPEALTPGLLVMLETELDTAWRDDDPRWYRDGHAGLLLSAFREPAALPLFAQVLWEAQRDYLFEWFGLALPYYYGPAAIPMLIEALEIEDGDDMLVSHASGMLTYIALHHPEERDRIIAALRPYLPSLDEAGALVITPEQRADPPVLWVWVINAFMDLRYDGADAVIKALFDADLVDPFVLGGWDDYRAAFAPDVDHPWKSSHVYDIVAEYEEIYEHERAVARKRMAAEARSASGPSRDASFDASRADPEPFVREEPKVGRNDPCPCGSGKKYKHCCGRRGA
jgi:hypothetical protein